LQSPSQKDFPEHKFEDENINKNDFYGSLIRLPLPIFFADDSSLNRT